MNHRPVCVRCQREMIPEQNGIGVLDMNGDKGFQLWDADLWKCPGCDVEIVVGFGQCPVSEHFEGERFNQMVISYKNDSQVIESRQKSGRGQS